MLACHLGYRNGQRWRLARCSAGRISCGGAHFLRAVRATGSTQCARHAPQDRRSTLRRCRLRARQCAAPATRPGARLQDFWSEGPRRRRGRQRFRVGASGRACLGRHSKAGAGRDRSSAGHLPQFDAPSARPTDPRLIVLPRAPFGHDNGACPSLHPWSSPEPPQLRTPLRQSARADAIDVRQARNCESGCQRLRPAGKLARTTDLGSPGIAVRGCATGNALQGNMPCHHYCRASP
jgi:hypothetical protein